MFTLISFILTAIFVIACTKSLKAHPLPYYIGAAVVAAGVFVIQLTGASRAFSPFVTDYIWALFFRGGIAGAFFATVMWTGAVPAKSKRIQQNMPIRGELSIIASILAIGHGAANGLTYFRYLFTAPSRMSVTNIIFSWCSIVMALIMLPLFITSFPKIRRKMKASSWKKLQRLAYVFYALMFAHVSLLYIPGLIAGRDYWLSYIIYCFVFVSYAICRVLKAIIKNVNIKMLKIQLVGNVLAVVITALVIVLIYMGASAQQMAKEVSAAQKAAAQATTGAAAKQEAVTQPETAEDATTGAVAEQETVTQPETAEDTTTGAAAEQETATVQGTTGAAEPDAGQQEAAAKYTDGTYYGTGDGYEGPISLSVTIENDLITWIEITDSIEDPEFMDPALVLIEDVINAQHTDLDAVSGSTYSSYGILDAIDEALAQARR